MVETYGSRVALVLILASFASCFAMGGYAGAEGRSGDTDGGGDGWPMAVMTRPYI